MIIGLMNNLFASIDIYQVIGYDLFVLYSFKGENRWKIR